MPNRIAGITVEIGGDTTKLNKALETVNGTIKGTQSQLKDVEKLLKLDPTNTELLAQKQSLLTQAVAGTSEKLDILKTAAQQAQTQLDQGKITQEQFNALQREIAETSNTMEQYNGKLSDSNSASSKLKTTISQQESELSSLKKQYTDRQYQYNKDYFVGDHVTVQHQFAADGTLKTGWRTVFGKRYYYDPQTGNIRLGWVDYIDDRYYVTLSEGKLVSQHRTIDGKRYWFDSYGVATESRYANFPDVNSDGFVSSSDASLVLQFSAACGAGNYNNDEDGWEKFLNDTYGDKSDDSGGGN